MQELTSSAKICLAVALNFFFFKPNRSLRPVRFILSELLLFKFVVILLF